MSENKSVSEKSKSVSEKNMYDLGVKDGFKGGYQTGYHMGVVDTKKKIERERKLSLENEPDPTLSIVELVRSGAVMRERMRSDDMSSSQESSESLYLPS